MNRYFLPVMAFFVVACSTPPKPAPVIEKPVVIEKKKPMVDLVSPLGTDEELVFEIETPDIKMARVSSEPAASTQPSSCLIVSSEDTYLHNVDQISDFLKENLSRKWVKPSNLNRKYQCFVSLHISESGCVSDIEINGCRDNRQLVRSIEIALFRSAPFPGINTELKGDSVQFEFFAGP